MRNSFSLKNLYTFFKQNPDFDLLTFDFHNPEDRVGLNWDNVDQGAQLCELQAYQRLLRILTPVVDGDGTAYHNQAGISDQAARLAENLLHAGFDSAHRIAGLSEHRFLREQSALFGGNEAVASQVYRRAAAVKAHVQHLVANIHGLVASPHYRQMLVNNTAGQVTDYFENIPSYQELFGSLDYLPCDHDSSIFGAAAYFLDLMRVTDEYITYPNSDIIPAGLKLQDRRPDLFELELTGENTNQTVPYIRIVNQVLERRLGKEALQVLSGTAQNAGLTTITLDDKASAENDVYNGMNITINKGTGAGQLRQITGYAGGTQKIATIGRKWETQPDKTSSYIIGKDPFQTLATAAYPFNLPFNLPLTQVRACMQSLKTTLGEAFLAFNPPFTGGRATNGTRDTISLAPDTPKADSIDTTMRIALIGGTGAGQIRNIKHYDAVQKVVTVDRPWLVAPDATSQYHILEHLGVALETLGLSREEYQNLITVQTDAGSLAASFGYETLDLKAIAPVETFIGRTGLSYDRLHELLYQDLSQAELQDRQAAKVVIDIVNPNGCKSASYGANSKYADVTSYINDAIPAGSIKIGNDYLGGDPLPGVVKHVDITYDDGAGEPYKTATVPENYILYFNYPFFINDTNEDLPCMQIIPDEAGSFYQIANLSIRRLDRLNRFIRLAEKLNWSFTDLDWALKSVAAVEINEQAIKNLAAIKRLQDMTGLGIVELCGLWHDLKTSGKGNGPNPQDPFDRIFNNPVLLNGRDPYTDNPPIPFDPTPGRCLTWSIDDTGGNNGVIRGRLRAVLQVNDNDLTLLGRYVCALSGEQTVNSQQLTLTLTNLSTLYRLAKTAAAFKLSVDEYLAVLGLIYYPAAPYLSPPSNMPLPTADQVLYVKQSVDWLKQSPFSVYELQYALTGETGQYYSPGGYQSGDIAPFMERLAAEAAGARLTPDSFVSELLGAEQSAAVFKQLAEPEHGLISENGIVLNDAAQYGAAAELYPIREDSFVTDDDKLTVKITADESKTVFQQLLDSHPAVLRAAGPSTATLAETFNLNTDLSYLFSGDAGADDKINQVRSFLLQQEKEIRLKEFDFLLSDQKSDRAEALSQIVKVIAGKANLQQECVLKGLAGFLGTTPQRIAAIVPLAAHADFRARIADLLTPLYKGQVPANIPPFIDLLSRTLLLFTLLDFNPREIAAAVEIPTAFNLENQTSLNLENIRLLASYKSLTRSWNDREGKLLAYLKSPGNQKAKERELEKLTHWDSNQIDLLVGRLWPAAFGASQYGYNTVSGLLRLESCFALSAKTGMEIASLLNLCQLSALSLLDDRNMWDGQSWSLFTGMAGVVLAAVNSKYQEEQAAAINQSLTAYLDTEKRNALLGYTIWILNKDYPVIQNPSGLYQYLLIDVEMSDADQISPIAQGIASLQLYMQRCRMMLEPGVADLSHIPDAWWEGLSNYRIWEANRKVFLYPENYLEPALRSGQTPEFKKLADALQQTDITEQNVSGAFTGYFQDVAALASLVHCDAYNHQVLQEGASPVNSLFLIGRSNTQPYTFYYRKWLDLKSWTSWQKIDLAINTQYITPVYAFNRLFIFWVEIEHTDSSAYDSGNPKETIPTSYDLATVKYSFLNSNGAWSEPQTISQRFIVDYQENYTRDTYDKIGYSGNIKDSHYKKVYPLYVPAASLTDPDQYPAGENIFLIYGRFTWNIPAQQYNLPQPGSNVNVIKKEFENKIYDVSKRYDQAVATKNMGEDSLIYNNLCLDINLESHPLDTTILQDSNPIALTAGVYSNKIGFASNPGRIIPVNIDDDYFAGYRNYIEALLNKIYAASSFVVTVKNMPGFHVFNNGDEAFLFAPQQKDIKSISNILTAAPASHYQGLSAREFYLSAGQYTESTTPDEQIVFQFYRLSTNVINTLKQRLQIGGISKLLTVESQQTPELDFNRLSPTEKAKAPAAQSIFNGAFGMYYWEIFFHAPFLVADILRSQKRFDEARKWYQYIFNPTQLPEAGLTDQNDRYWRFLPFRELKLPALVEILTDPGQIIAYNDDPFDPDAIARLRPSAYMKAIVMRYIDNLLAWADYLFAQDTRESITQATNLYVMAADLLGPRPEAIGEAQAPAAKSFNEIRGAYCQDKVSGQVVSATSRTVTLDSKADAAAGAYTGMYISITGGTGHGQTDYLIINYENRVARLEKAWQTIPRQDSTYKIAAYRIPQFLIQLENTALMGETLKAEASFTSPAFNDIDSYFAIPGNSELAAYWDQVEDRLYKIRHSMNIKGDIRALAQFEPPVDVRQLVRTAAGGGGVVDLINAASLQIPYYRFPVMLEKAKTLTTAVTQLGASLLGALEKKDAEELALLAATQEKALLNLTTYLKEQQLNEATQAQSALKESLQSAQYRLDHFKGLLDQGLSTAELLSIGSMTVAMIANGVAGTIGTLAAAAYAAPQVGSPFAMTYGGQQVGSSLMAAKEAAEIGAMVSNYIAQLSSTMAGYQRRAEEWQVQVNLAFYDVAQINYQLAAGEIRRQISQRELEIHRTTLNQNAAKEAFLRTKFTNRELYQWMVEQLSTVYFQTYNIAFELARSAQRAYQFELNTNQTFINFGYWNDLKKGLLAGEGLMSALNLMEKAYLDNNSRTLEIEKTASLMQLDPQALLSLKTSGECEFALTEKLFDNDYPGHYARKIKTISISIPAVVGPYQNIKATLTQTGNSTIIKPDVNAVDFLLGNTQTIPGTDVMRSNWWPNQQIAISRGTDDAGLFQLNFNDERYLPFEGTGAVSGWRLSLPKSVNLFSFDAISDVIIQVRYTAIDGGADFKQQVSGLSGMNLYAGSVTNLMAQDFSQEWYTFLHEHPGTDSQSLRFELTNPAPANIKQAKLTGFYFKLDVPAGVNPTGNNNYLTFQVTGKVDVNFNLDTNGTYTHIFKTATELVDVIGSRSITFNLGENETPADLITKTQPAYLDPTVIRNIVLILFYQGVKE